MRFSAALCCAVLVAATGACNRKPAAAPAPRDTTLPSTATTTDRDRADSVARAEAARADSIVRAARAAAEAVAARQRLRDDSLRAAAERTTASQLAGLRATIAAPIRFDYDRAELSEDARAALDAKLRILNSNPDLRLRIAGHTDNRGSDEYNLALGQRRAAAAKAYFVQNGIDASRFEIVSFGEERPAVEGEDEGSWSQNRRDEFDIIAGGARLAVPAR